MKKYNIFLLDLDETLLDFNKSEKTAIREVFLSNSLPFNEEIYENYHKINYGLWKRYEKGEIKKEDIFSNRFKMLSEKFNINCSCDLNVLYFDRLGKYAFVMDGAFELLELLSGKGRVYIITNGREAIQKNRIALSGIDKYLNGVFISETIGKNKPEKEFFDYVAKNINGFDKEKTMIIGDSLSSDILGGINSGIDTVWLNLLNEETKDIIPTYKVKSCKEIVELLKNACM